MPTLYFIFGHLLGDFVLQPNELISWKFKSWRGTFFHSIIHFLIYLLVFFPYLPDLTVFLTVLGVSAGHFLIDFIKVETEKSGRRYRFYFMADQLAHLGLMMAAGSVLGGLQPNFALMSPFSIIYENAYMIVGLIILILLTYFLELWFFQGKRESTPEMTFKPDYDAMLKRAAVFTAVFGAFMIFGVYKAAAMG